MVRTNRRKEQKRNIIEFSEKNKIKYCKKCGKLLSIKIKEKQHHFYCHQCWLDNKMYPDDIYEIISLK